MSERTVSARVLSVALICAAALAIMACAGHNRPDTIVSDPSIISRVEIDSSHAMNAFEVITRLRPMFLVSRGKVDLQAGSSNALPNVYVDDQLYGDVTTLRAIAASTIETIRFYNAAEAQYKYGKGNAAGAISIQTRH